MKRHLEQLKKIKREKHHPLLHEVHRKFGISRKTLFYVKEYGPHSNVPRRIIKESLEILVLASIISSFGGLSIEYIKTIFVSIIPLIILLPTLNGMVGGYGIIISSRFSTMLHEGRIKMNLFRNLLESKELRKLFVQIFIISIITVIISSIAALIISRSLDYVLTSTIVYKLLLITIVDTIILISILFLIAVFAGLYFYKKQEDPNNFLIPITTSIADFGNMFILAVLVMVFF